MSSVCIYVINKLPEMGIKFTKSDIRSYMQHSICYAAFVFVYTNNRGYKLYISQVPLYAIKIFRLGIENSRRLCYNFICSVKLEKYNIKSVGKQVEVNSIESSFNRIFEFLCCLKSLTDNSSYRAAVTGKTKYAVLANTRILPYAVSAMRYTQCGILSKSSFYCCTAYRLRVSATANLFLGA